MRTPSTALAAVLTAAALLAFADHGEVQGDQVTAKYADAQEHMDALARSGNVAVLAVQFRLELEPWLLAAIPWAEVPWEVPRSRHV